MSKAGSPKYHHGNLRAELLEAALKRLAAQTVETLSLRELAQVVGVSIAAVYRHFPNKETLLAEVAADGFDRMVAQWDERLPELRDVGAEARFRRLGALYIEFALEAPALYRLMFVHGDLRRFPSLQAAAQRCFSYVLGAAADTVREAGADAKWALPTANTAWSLVHGYVMLSLGGRLIQVEGAPALEPDMVAQFFRLPKEALP